MADGVKYRDPKTGFETVPANAKLAKILEAGGYVKVTATTPKLPVPEVGPSTVAEHVAAAKEAEKKAPAEVEKK